MNERPLVITDDEQVLDDLLRIAAAAGVEVTHCREPESRARWRSAAVVLIDAALVPRGGSRPASAAARCGGRRRRGARPRSCGNCACGSASTGRCGWTSRAEALIGLLSDAVVGGTGNGRCVAVLGACGGAGASVFAAAVAFAAARGRRCPAAEVFLVDCDPWGAGLDVMLGIENESGPALGRSGGAVRAAAGRCAAPGAARGRGGRRAGGGVVSRPGAGGDIVAEVARCRAGRGPPGRRHDGRRSAAAARPVADRVLEQADLIVLVAPADVRGLLGGRPGVRPDQASSGRRPGWSSAVRRRAVWAPRELADVLGLPLLARMRAGPGAGRWTWRSAWPAATGRRRPLAGGGRGVVLDSLRAAS